ncbi:MAG: hypothetical protein EA422_00385 [Gemmatimonadales bacterium]|nr:MAG: hypothetical protein EA422_00385 [Gemmatimonadales bacterium]
MRSLFLLPALLLLALILVACGDRTPPPPGTEELAEVEEGASMSEVLALLPAGDLPENGTVQGYQRNRFLIDGAAIEVVWVHAPGSGGTFAHPRLELNPLIFVGGALDGWGWAHFDARADEWSLPMPQQPMEG